MGGGCVVLFKSQFSLPWTHAATLRTLHRIRMTTEISHSGGKSGPWKESPLSTQKYSTAAGESAYLHASSAIDFLSLCRRLKTTKRAGWVRREVQEPESIADHMYRMGVMALIAADIPGVNRDRYVWFEGKEGQKALRGKMKISILDWCIKMAIVHDIAEAIVGDITPSDGVPKEEKSRRESEALDHMCKLLGGGSGAKEIAELWTEYEENSSPEAKIVKDFDKVEMILQAFEYENEQGKDLKEFFESTAGKFQTDVGKAWAAEIIARRKRRGA